MDLSQRQQKRIADLLKGLDEETQKAFFEAIGRAATSVDINALIAALEYAAATGDTSRAENLLRLDQSKTFPLAEALRSAFIAGGQTVGGNLPLSLRAAFGFGGNPRAMADVDRITGDLITNLTETNREMVIGLTRDLVKRAVNTGIPVRTAALEIVGIVNPKTGLREGGYLGLDVPRAQQAAKVAAMLRDPVAIKDYFIGDKPRYTTTDRRFDKMVRDAINAGTALSQADADRITKLHRARLLKNRGETISRNETLNALRAGERAGFQQLVDSGAVRDDQITREWLPTKDARTRHDHMAMAGQKVKGMGAPFTFPNFGGQAMYPGDTSLGALPRELIQCRCAVSYRIARK